MDDNSAKRQPTDLNESGQMKKSRGTFFKEDIEGTVANLKRDLADKTRANFYMVIKESQEIFNVLNANTTKYFQLDDSSSSDENELIFGMDDEDEEVDLEKCPAKIQLLMEFSHGLTRIRPFCTFVDVNLLTPFKEALSKIREACGCDLNDPNTWNIAQPYTQKLCEVAMDLESRKSILLKKYDFLYDEMELFIQSYKASKKAQQEKFLSAILEDNMLMTWLRPWLDIAQGKSKPILEDALMESIKVFPQQQSLAVKQGV